MQRPFMWIGVGLLIAANVLGLLRLGAEVAAVGVPQAVGHVGFDWLELTKVGRLAIVGDDPYQALYRWTPAAAWLLYWVTLIPWPVWQLAHVVAALAMPTRTIRVMTLSAYPFWYDVMVGNVMVFIALAGVWAWRGNRPAAIAFLAGALLIPRPLMLPLAIWLLWRCPMYRIPTLLIGMGVIAGSLAVGHLGEWAARLQIEDVINLAPSALIGVAWIPIGVSIAAWMTWRGRPGWASVAVQPYLIPNYFLMLLLEYDRPDRPARIAQPRAQP